MDHVCIMNSKKARNYLDLLVSVNLAKAKWKNLKDKFRIELKKIPECRSGSEAHEYKGKWPFFNMMMFMRDIVAPSNTEGNLGNSIPSAVTSDVDTDTEITITSPISPTLKFYNGSSKFGTFFFTLFFP